jgi:hypothetical protein
MSSSNWLRDFQCLDFPDIRYLIYVFGIDFHGTFRPFYVGETSKGVGARIGDYISKQKTASTDLQVGTAVERFKECNHKVKVYYKESDKDKKARKAEENKWKKKAREKAPLLLNDLRFRKVTPEEREKKIRDWVDVFLSELKTEKVS